jgi:hypothetical protein
MFTKFVFLLLLNYVHFNIAQISGSNLAYFVIFLIVFPIC